MPNYLSEVELPSGDEYQFKDKQTRTNLGLEGSLMSKTYTGIIGEANNAAGATFYAIKVVPDDYDKSWFIRYRITAEITGVSEVNGLGHQESEVYICGMRNTYANYWVWNTIRNTTYQAYRLNSFYRAKAAGVTGGYGHVIGVGLRESWNRTNVSYPRTITVEILDYGDCTVSLFDQMLLYADLPGTGSTNYDTLTEFNGYNQGCTQSGDQNTHDRSAYVGSIYKAGSTAIVAANIIVGDTNGLYHHLKTGTAFDIRHPILYASSAVKANANLTNIYVDLPFDVTTTQAITLTQGKPVFIKGQLSGTTFTPVSTTPLTQILPTDTDGYEYIRLGYAYAATTMHLEQVHPIFAYRGGKIVQIVGDATTVNGHTIESDVPSNFSTVFSRLNVTAGSPNNAIYFNSGIPTPVDHSIGHDEDENVIVAWEGGEAITPDIPTGSALPISQGGTGATTAVNARTNLGLGSAATYNVVSSVNDDSNLVTGGAIKAYYEAVGIPSAISTTSAATASKVATCSSYSLLANSYIQVILASTNTASSALTLNINGKGAKPIYINGTVSSSSNKTLPAGSYFVYYDGTNYYFRTDGKLTADITGTVNGHTVNKDVPSNAVFTDTTALTSMTGTLPINHGGTNATTADAARTNLGLTDLIVTRSSSAANVTVGSAGYIALASTHPKPTVDGYTFLFAYIKTWSSTSPVGAFSITGTGAYAIGPASMKINGLVIDFVYIKNL